MVQEVEKHILVVDDDASVRKLLEGYLADHGYLVHSARDGTGMAEILAGNAVDLVILDLILPGENGLDLAKKLRKDFNVPIIMLTGKGDEIDRVIGLKVGADDYLPKPFSPRELLARIRSVLRRSDGAAETATEEGKSRKRARFAGWTLDLGVRQLRSYDDLEVALTPGEFDLLSVFVNHRNRVLSREQLLEFARDDDGAAFDRSIDIHVMRLRRKMEPDPKKPGADGRNRPLLHGAPLLRGTAHREVAERTGLAGGATACRTVDEPDGAGGDLSPAQHQPAGTGPQGLPVPAARAGH